MAFHYYTGSATTRPSKPKDVPSVDRAKQDDPAHYQADPQLVNAVNVALILGQPLLLTGDPGTGKTQFAYHLAFELGFDGPHKFDTKSTSTASDLFYRFDSLRRFQAAQGGGDIESNLQYITFNALGKAILLGMRTEDIHAWLAQHKPGATPENTNALLQELGHPGKPRRSVVLIDEIDKAPRDFPNDLLNEVEYMYFQVPELGPQRITVEPDMRPVLILTSNSERNLPDAFLRRCVFYNIPRPDAKRLASILSKRVPNLPDANCALMKSAVEFFLKVRDENKNLRKAPSTAELINWVQALVRFGALPGNALNEVPDAARATVHTLGKTIDDAKDIADMLNKELA